MEDLSTDDELANLPTRLPNMTPRVGKSVSLPVMEETDESRLERTSQWAQSQFSFSHPFSDTDMSPIARSVQSYVPLLEVYVTYMKGKDVYYKLVYNQRTGEFSVYTCNVLAVLALPTPDPPPLRATQRWIDGGRGLWTSPFSRKRIPPCGSGGTSLGVQMNPAPP